MAPSLQQHMQEIHRKLQTNYIRVDQEWLFEYDFFYRFSDLFV